MKLLRLERDVGVMCGAGQDGDDNYVPQTGENWGTSRLTCKTRTGRGKEGGRESNKTHCT